MRITNRQLRQVIKEELKNRIAEGNFFNMSSEPVDETSGRVETPVKAKFDLSGFGISFQPEVTGMMVEEPDFIANRAKIVFAGGLFEIGAGGSMSDEIKSGVTYPYELYVFDHQPRQHDTKSADVIIKLSIRKA